jgi:serine/threonine protein kinase
VDIRVGSVVSGYRIESVIGRGGMGVVYLAEHLQLQRKAALKILAPELASDERFRSRFLRESQLAASIDHPNVVTVHDTGEADGLLYIAMRYVEGTDHKTLIQRDGPLDPSRAVAIVEQVGSALDAAHEKGLIHRDVKPANVLLDAAGRAYLTDFGLTRRTSSESGLTRTGQFLGTADYDAHTYRKGRSYPLETDPIWMTSGGGAIWIAGKDGKVQKFTLDGGIDAVQLPGNPVLNDVFYDASGVWVTAPKQHQIWKLDPESPNSDPTPITLPWAGFPTRVAAGQGAVWVVEEPALAGP